MFALEGKRKAERMANSASRIKTISQRAEETPLLYLHTGVQEEGGGAFTPTRPLLPEKRYLHSYGWLRELLFENGC